MFNERPTPISADLNCPCPDVVSSVIERGEDHAVYRIVTRSDDESGNAQLKSREFTVVGHALHYYEDEEWKPTEDGMEDFGGDGVAALRGPHQAMFAPTLDADRVFEITMADRGRFGGRIGELRIAHLTTGESRSLASIRTDVRATLESSNRVVYGNAFEGLAADIVYVWRRDAFLQDVELRELPELPLGWRAETTELQVVTDFTLDTPVTVSRAGATTDDQAPLDDTLIHFGRMSLVVGRAFPSTEGSGSESATASRRGTPVRKRWEHLERDHYRLVESVPWKVLMDSAHVGDSTPFPEAGKWEDRREALVSPDNRRALAVPFVIDFLIVPQNQIHVFQKGITYYVQSPYQVTVPSRVDSGTFLKFAPDAELRLLGPMQFPLEQPYAVFTSRNDDLYGERILGVPGDTPSDGNPSAARAAVALFVDHQAGGNIVRNLRVRWAQTCIQYAGTAAQVAHIVQDTLLEHSDVGVRADVPATSAVGLRDVRVCNVTTPTSGGTFWPSPIGNVVSDASDWPHHQADPAIAVRVGPDGDIYRGTVVVASLSRRGPNVLPDVGILRSISRDGGRTWDVVGYIATGTDLPLTDGDPDPSLVYDDFNNLHLAYRAVGAEKVICAISEDDGLTWRRTDGFSGETFAGFQGAMPTLAYGRRPGRPQGSLWLTLHRDGGGELQCAGTEVRGFGWSNVGGQGKWVISGPIAGAENVKFHGIAVGPSEEVVVVVTQGKTPPGYDDAPVTFRTLINSAGYPSADFEHLASADFTLAHMGATILAGAFVDPLPVLAWDRPRNRLYLTYTTRSAGADESQTRVVVRAYDKALPGQWQPEVAVQPASTHSQFHPRVVVDERSGHVAVIWYDRKDDPANFESHLYAGLSRNGFHAPGNPLLIRVSPTPASHAASGYDFKEFIGLAAHDGFLYPAWVGNGTTFGPAWDILVARVPF